MLLKILKKFHAETERRYKEGLEENMASWKKDMLKLHELSDFIFYPDEFQEWDEEDGSCILLGSLVKGNPREGHALYLYSGQAELLGEGILLEEIVEADLKLAAFTRERKYLCSIQVDFEEEEVLERIKRFQKMNLQLSMLSDVSPEKMK